MENKNSKHNTLLPLISAPRWLKRDKGVSISFGCLITGKYVRLLLVAASSKIKCEPWVIYLKMIVEQFQEWGINEEEHSRLVLFTTYLIRVLSCSSSRLRFNGMSSLSTTPTRKIQQYSVVYLQILLEGSRLVRRQWVPNMLTNKQNDTKRQSKNP